MFGPMAVSEIQTGGGDLGRQGAAENPRDLGRKAQGPPGRPSPLAAKPSSPGRTAVNGRMASPSMRAAAAKTAAPFRGPPPVPVKGRTKRKCRRFRAGIPNVIEA